MRKVKYLIIFITGICLSVLTVKGSDPVTFPEIEGWETKVSNLVYTPENLWDLINGAAESYNSFDFQDLHLADYRNGGGIEIHAEIYRHSSLPNAFGIYALERSPEYNFLDIGAQGYLEEGVLNMFTGPYYVKLYSTASDRKVQESLQVVAKKIAGHLGEGDSWPEPLLFFPEEGKLANRESYVRENFLGFNFLQSAYTADYKGGFSLFVIEGKNNEEILEMARAYLDFTKQAIDPSTTPAFTVTDKYNGYIPVIIKDHYMAGITGGAESGDALMVLDALMKNLGKE